MRLDWTRLIRGLALLAWALFFDFLWLTDRGSLYVGPRTTWVVAFGGITLTAAAILYLSGVRTSERTPVPRTRELAGLGVIVAPIVFAAMAPAVTLGAQAVGQKRAADGAALAKRLASDGSELRLYELAAAASNPRWANIRGIRPGMKVNFDGFVSRPPRDGTLELSRFMATCCAADAVPYSIDVVLPPDSVGAEKNQWFEIHGSVETGKRAAFMVVADSAEPIDRPIDAYG
jgi:uncharacterized repeat protein (TIGR03943 family)